MLHAIILSSCQPSQICSNASCTVDTNSAEPRVSQYLTERRSVTQSDLAEVTEIATEIHSGRFALPAREMSLSVTVMLHHRFNSKFTGEKHARPYAHVVAPESRCFVICPGWLGGSLLLKAQE